MGSHSSLDTGPSSFVVTVDDRERGAGVAEALAAMNDVEVRFERLAVGDYAVGTDLLFERKTLVDLAASLKDGRLLRQAARLAAVPQRGVVVLEGTARDLAGSRMRREAIQGALIHLTVFLDLPLLRSRDPAETARLIGYTARQQHARRRGLPRRPHRRLRSKRRAQMYVLQGLPAVGPERARRLLDAFGSVEAVFQAAPDELLQVDGIGTTTAESIRWAVGEPEVAFGADDDPVL